MIDNVQLIIIRNLSCIAEFYVHFLSFISDGVNFVDILFPNFILFLKL